jgi:hypothetical protein
LVLKTLLEKEKIDALKKIVSETVEAISNNNNTEAIGNLQKAYAALDDVVYDDH